MSKLAHRKAALRLLIQYPDGTPASHCALKIDQTGHQFLFGCGGFDAFSLAMTKDPDEQHFLEERLEKWLGLFNYATVPFYWGRYEPAEGKTYEKEMRIAARWLKDRGVKVKGHPLCWHTVCADWLLPYSNEQIMQKQLDRIHREVSSFRGLIDCWDVINEVVIMPVFDKYDNAVTRLCKEKGRVGLVKEVFAAARNSNPDALLLINDFNTSPEYEHLLEDLLEADVPIGAIGIQSHQHQGYWGLEKLQDVLARFSRFKLPIHFTENTLISGELMPEYIVDLNDWQVESWPGTPEGEARQAAETAEMLTELFSHPLVDAFTIWDFADGGWLGAPAGLIRKDNTIKPVYDTLKNLIHGAWETHENLVTDQDGFLQFEGFKGDYEIRCGSCCGMFGLDGSCQDLTVKLSKEE